MMTLMEDIRLALRQLSRSSDAVMTALPLIVLGIALNVVTLHVVDGVRVKMGGQQTARAACEKRSPVQRVVAPLRKMMGHDQHRWCAAKGWVKERRAEVMMYKAEVEQVVYCALGQTSRC